MEAVRVNRSCAFCSKREWQVSRLVQGTTAVICEECVAAAAGLLGEPKPESGEQTLALPALHASSRFAFQAIQRHFDWNPVRADRERLPRVLPSACAPICSEPSMLELATGTGGFHGLHSSYRLRDAALRRVARAGPVLRLPRPAAFRGGRRRRERAGPMLQRALWLRRSGSLPYAVYLTTAQEYGRDTTRHAGGGGRALGQRGRRRGAHPLRTPRERCRAGAFVSRQGAVARGEPSTLPAGIGVAHPCAWSRCGR